MSLFDFLTWDEQKYDLSDRGIIAYETILNFGKVRILSAGTQNVVLQ
jgi:hypothetical protein